MKITDVRLEMFKWPRDRPITNGLYTYTHNLLNVVVVETDQAGLTGIGLAGGVEVTPEIGRVLVEHFKKMLLGLDPLDHERIWYEMWRPKLVGRRGITTRVLGGIDIALYRGNFDPMHGRIWAHSLDIEDGMVKAPDRPGFGLEPRWDALAPYKVA